MFRPLSATKAVSLFITLLTAFLMNAAAQAQTYTIWSSTVVPSVPSANDTNPAELGVKFKSDTAGKITGIRFYKGSKNTGTHTGSLWSSTGTLLANATFTSETSSGWQQVNFSTPVAITANTTYVASYHTNTGYYAYTNGYFANSGDNPPLHALSNTAAAGNGVYIYGSGGVFPNNTYQSSNYWVDVVFTPSTTTTTYAVSGTITGGASSTVTLSGAKAATTTADASGNFSFTGLANGNYTVTPSKSGYSFTPTNKAVSVSGANVTGVNFTASATTTATYSVSGTVSGVAGSTVTLSGAKAATTTADASGNFSFTGLANGTYTVTPSLSGYSFTPTNKTVTVNGGNLTGVNFTAGATTSSNCPCSIWSSSTVPAAIASDANSVELGVKFQSDVAGSITGIRFYKGSTNTGTHTGTLWSSTGSMLATATFANETASGWQQVNFSTPVAITANTTYVASYHTSTGHYAVNQGMFANAVDNAPLHALSNSAPGGNGVYVYGATAYPTNTWQSSNYWVDVVFTTSSTTPTGPTTYYSISGTVSGGAGAVVSLTGAKTASATADSNGNYTFTGLLNGSYTVTPTKSGYTMTPTTKAVSVAGANVTAVNFTATAATTASHSVTLNWTASTTSTVSGYYVYRSTTSGSGYSKLNSTPNTSTTYSDTNVAAGVTYYYVVTSVNSSGQESTYSNQATATIPTP